VAIAMVVLFCCDSLMRGGVDTLRNVLPMLYCGADRDALSKFNSKFQVVYQLAGAVGPALVGIFMAIDPAVCLMFIVGVYACAMLGFAMMPNLSHATSGMVTKKADKPGKKKKPDKSFNKEKMWKALKQLKNMYILAPFVAQSFIQGQRLKAVLATVFAKDIINEHTGASAGYVMAGQGIGGVVAAIMFNFMGTCMHPRWWLAFGIFGTTCRTWGWIPSMEWQKHIHNPQLAAVPYIGANVLYGFSSNCAVIAIQSLLQQRCMSVEIVAFQRFLVRLSGVFTKIWCTAIIASYEYTTGNYEDAFLDISIALTFVFILPQCMAFCYFVCCENEEEIDKLLVEKRLKKEAKAKARELGEVVPEPTEEESDEDISATSLKHYISVDGKDKEEIITDMLANGDRALQRFDSTVDGFAGTNAMAPHFLNRKEDEDTPDTLTTYGSGSANDVESGK